MRSFDVAQDDILICHLERKSKGLAFARIRSFDVAQDDSLDPSITLRSAQDENNNKNPKAST